MFTLNTYTVYAKNKKKTFIIHLLIKKDIFSIYQSNFFFLKICFKAKKKVNKVSLK